LTRKLAQEDLAAVRAGEDSGVERQALRGAPTVKEATSGWSDTGRVTLTETDTGIAANRLNGYDAIELHALLKSVG